MSASRHAATLELRGLSKSFGSVQAMRDLSLTVPPGSLLTLLGASGSGKSTTLMAIAGFQRADHGAVLIDGRDVSGLAPHQRDIGIVFQHYALFPHMTVAQNVGFPLRMRRRPRAEIAARVARMLDLVRLGPLAGRMPDQLSGGQQQRVALARALVFEPAILLLDEPLSALDRKLREEMQAEIRALQQALRITTIAVTHDQQEALTLSDQVAVMRHGRIEQMAAPAELFERPANAFVADFMGGTNILRVQAAPAPGGVGVTLPGGGRGAAMAPADLRAPGAADLLIRPERIALSPPDGAPLRGRILSSTYVGGAWRSRVQLPDGTEIVAEPPGAQPPPAQGSETGLRWSAEDAWAMPVEAGGDVLPSDLNHRDP
ncbi:ABC transporter ATP-binding protein [Roseomonas gilardii]|uniref:ABC transporter ATP-binding protein n=1 Tax=Roseomonas gilardii TaxID=257708 RepID=UPI0011A2C626|nr:ABC transporter ATP-binding protein [Roseomonas gilardii]